MYALQQSTALTVPFFAFDASGDPVTGKVTGDWTKRISKASGAFGAMTVTVTEKEGGWYDLVMDTGHTDTLGLLSVYLTATGVKQVNLQWMVTLAGEAGGNLTHIDGQATTGNNATLNLKQLNIVNNAGSALVASSTGGNGHGLRVVGQGSGEGISAQGGSTGHGIAATGGSISGHGFAPGADGDGAGIYAAAVGAWAGISATGGVTGRGAEFIGGAALGASPAGAGIYITGGAASATGGGTAAPAIVATGGAGAASTNGAASGVTISGGGTNTVASTASGIVVTGTSNGHGLSAVGGATSGDGINATATAGNGHGLRVVGNGSGDGLSVQGGATGDGIDARGGATSGDAIYAYGGPGGAGFSITGNNYHGLTLGATGTGRHGLWAYSTAAGAALFESSGGPTIGIYGASGTDGVGIDIWGGDALGATPANAGIRVVGGSASTTGGGVASPAIVATGGAGAASTNGAAAGAAFSGGGTNTVASEASGLVLTGTSTGDGLSATAGPTGHGIDATGGSTSGDGIRGTVTSGSAFGDALVDSILDRAITEPSGVWAWPASLRKVVGWMGALSRNKITQTATTQTVRNDADDATISTSTHSDDGTTHTRGEFS